MMELHENDVVAVGCPVGSLSAELAKDTDDLHILSRSVFELMRKWVTEQFSALGFNQADDRSMDMLARMQGIAVITCAFRDREFLHRSTTDIKNWVNSLTLN